MGRFRRHLRHRRARHLRPDDLPFRRVVIHKHHAIRHQIQFLRDLQQVPVLRLPVRLDLDKVIGTQHPRRMVQPRDRIFMIILGSDIQQNAEFFIGFQIFLKRTINLPGGSFMPQYQIFNAVIPHDAAPERIVQIQNKGLLVFPIDGFDDLSHAERKFRNRRHAERILVAVPVKRIRPLL